MRVNSNTKLKMQNPKIFSYVNSLSSTKTLVLLYRSSAPSLQIFFKFKPKKRNKIKLDKIK